MKPLLISLAAASFLLAVAGCGTSASQGTPTPTTAVGRTASGDIPDTATYLTYHGHAYSLRYVEGWGIQPSSSGNVAITDKDSAETVAVVTGNTHPQAMARADLSRLTRGSKSFHLISSRVEALPAGPSVRAQYRTLSPKDPVTGKRVPVLVDRYYISGHGKEAVLTLQTPRGVDNVDAFRLIAHSFRWH